MGINTNNSTGGDFGFHSPRRETPQEKFSREMDDSLRKLVAEQRRKQDRQKKLHKALSTKPKTPDIFMGAFSKN